VVNYRLLPHVGDWRATRPDRQAYAMLEPLVARVNAESSATLTEGSLISIDAPNVVLSVVKLAEGSEGKRLLVRGFETDGLETRMTIECQALGQSWTHTVRPFEIWTLALPLDGGAPQALNLLEEALG